MLDWADGLHYAVEAVKILGGFASFYAVVKLRQIERRYLFKATIPQMVDNIQKTLDELNACMGKSGNDRLQVALVLNVLIVDVKNIRRKAHGDSLRAAKALLKAMSATRPRRFFWQADAPLAPKRQALLDIYGLGMGLIRSLENDLKDQRWSSK
ncbi:hypothetical protein HF313_24565 [Massilia atriviolacea]|uniref:Uncharacterized protein n=1 Tax=Massilia atriviolacea TaxID=2495579 RepID=A0A430HJV7_9BURK|nr:hypothetical protein [Massilia atriviolacea]RSZ57817.1 hypothetical protein EJB06_15920 [Massilia atriviolacea]